MSSLYAMEPRKQQEIEHYEQKAREWRADPRETKWSTDVHGVRPDTFASYRFVKKWLHVNCASKRVLDYGCGTGIHSVTLAKAGAQVTGIDLSEESLTIARQRAKRAGVTDHVTFLKMDCERLEFPDHSFDIVLDGGTFSSIDLDRALPEIARVLKPGGVLIGIETFGHNPLANLKRTFNRIRKVRTAWAAAHIMRMEDFDRLRKYCTHLEVHYFHLLSIALLPLLRVPGATPLFQLLDHLDTLLLKLPFLKKYAFKIVFICVKDASTLSPPS